MDPIVLQGQIAGFLGGVLGMTLVFVVLSKLFGFLASFAVRPQGQRVITGSLIAILCIAAILFRAVMDHARFATPGNILAIILGATITLAMSRRRARKISERQDDKSLEETQIHNVVKGSRISSALRMIVLWGAVATLVLFILRPSFPSGQVAEEITQTPSINTPVGTGGIPAQASANDGSSASSTGAIPSPGHFISASDFTNDNFHDYPAAIYAGPVHMPDFIGRDRAYATYRTRIRQGLAGGVNFAGNIAMIEIGCGTMCRDVYAANVATGEVHTFPLGGERSYKLSVNYQPDSRLVIAVWENYAANQCYKDRYLWDGALFHLVDRITIGAGDAC